MKKFFYAAFVFSLLLAGCKSKKILPQAETVSKESEEIVFTAPSTSQPATTQKPATTYEPSNVRSQSESFTFAHQADAGKYTGNYFVIIGSFSSMENANRYKQELIPLGFNPVVLRSETGYYRVCVNSYDDEGAARRRIQQIRTDFPKHADTWLLIKQ